MNRENRDFLPKKRSNSDSINFLALMSGMITSLMAILLVWSYFSTSEQPAEAAPRSFSRAAIQVSNSNLPISVEDLDGSRPITVDQLEDLLERINDWDKKAPVAVKVSQNENRVKVADRLYEKAKSDQQRHLAIESKLSALGALYGLDYLHELDLHEIGPSLRELALENRRSANQKIAIESDLQLLKVDAFESTKQDNPDDLESLVDQITDLLNRYPENEFVLSTVDLVIKSLSGHDASRGTEIRYDLISRADEFRSSFNQNFIQNQIDQIKLAEVQIGKLFDNRWIDGESGRKNLFYAAMQLAGDKQGGVLVLREVVKTLNWLEQTDRYDQCKQICEVLLKTADEREVESMRLKARATAKKGLARYQLIGKTIELNGNQISGQSLDQSELENKIVVLLFWSESSPETFKQLEEFHNENKSLLKRDVRVLAVCIDEQADEKLAVRGRQIPAFQIVVNSSASPVKNWIGHQYPVELVPNSLIVNRLGKVVDINIPFDEIVTSTKLVAMDREVALKGSDSEDGASPTVESSNSDQVQDDQ